MTQARSSRWTRLPPRRPNDHVRRLLTVTPADDPGERLERLAGVWRETAEAVRTRGGQAEDPVVDPPASDQAIGSRIPSGVRDLLHLVGGAAFSWTLEQTPGPEWGSAQWTPASVSAAERDRRDWVQAAFPAPDDPYDAVWHGKFGLLSVRNGDCIAVDLQAPGEPVVYLSHDDGDGHGMRLGHSAVDFIRRWTMLGCVGPEGWELAPFERDGILDPDSRAGREWRAWLRQGR